MGKRNKYKLRSDGRRETTKLYNDFGTAHYSGKKHFYGKTDDEVDEKIAAFEESLNQSPETYKITVEQVADAWWEWKEPQLSPNSINSFRAKKNEISEVLGSMPIEDLGVSEIIHWLEGVAAAGRAQRGINDRRSVLKMICDYAIYPMKILSANPCTNLPKVKGKAAKKRHPASDGDIQKIEAAKKDSLISRMYYFMEYSGCRIGECVTLQQKHIDLENRKAFIVQDIAYRTNKPEIKNTAKSEAGTREVDLYDNVIEILPVYDDPETFIFFPDGLPLKSQLRDLQEAYKKKYEISATAHQMRHSYAGIMHSAEIDAKDTQHRMGHSTVAITEDIYTEIEQQYNAKVRDKANRYIMEERLKSAKVSCPECGSLYTKSQDGHVFKYCPDCGILLCKSSSESSVS